jgi:hypothetical protein
LYCLQHIDSINLFGLISIASLLYCIRHCLSSYLPHPTADLYCLQHIDGINLFGLISIASLLYCVPAALYVERAMWAGAWQTAVTTLGTGPFYQLLLMSGLFYHLYNQVNAQKRVSSFFLPWH